MRRNIATWWPVALLGLSPPTVSLAQTPVSGDPSGSRVAALLAVVDELRAGYDQPQVPASKPCLSVLGSDTALLAELTAAVPDSLAWVAPECPIRRLGGVVHPDAPPLPRDHVEPMFMALSNPMFEYPGIAWVLADWRFASASQRFICAVRSGSERLSAECYSTFRSIG